MTLSRTFRKVALAALLTVAAALCAPALLAQRGGPPPPPPPGGSGGPGGGPGNPGGGMGMGGGIRLPNGPPNISGSVMHGGSALGLPGRWWNDRHFIKQLSLRPEQQKRMDAIFDAHKVALANSLQNLQHERAQLGSLSRKDLEDENKVLASIDRVVAARADLAKETTHLLAALRSEMDPQQSAAFDQEIQKNRQ